MKDLASQLQGVSTVAILGHVRPDGDCVGSCLATWNYIRTWYPKIKARVYLEPIPNIFRFLKGAEEIVHEFADEPAYDLCIVQDCGDAGRLGDAVKYFEQARRTVCIDHHVSNSSFADENYIYPEASATSELIFGLLEEERVTREIAECLYVGIVHDTGVFQYSSTSAKTMNIAGKLMERGIDFTRIVDETFYTKTWSQNRIMGKVLMESRMYLEGACVLGVATQADMKQFDVLPKHLDGIVNQLRVTRDVEVAVFLYENQDGSYKVSMRSNGKVNVAEIAMKYSGGGHVMAAGVTMEGTPDEIMAALLGDIEGQLASWTTERS